MGALSASTTVKWMPEDDLLLKNAVEAGASLESLARGAVSFSRRFTLRELQDRWNALLYDSATSAEASARIIEFELRLSNSNPNPNNPPNKLNRFSLNNSKGKEISPQKRSVDTVRNRYYAMRKRVCTDNPVTGNNSSCGNADIMNCYLENEITQYGYPHNLNPNPNPNANPNLVGTSFEHRSLQKGPHISKICPAIENKIPEMEMETFPVSNLSGNGIQDGVIMQDPDPIWRAMQADMLIDDKDKEQAKLNNTGISQAGISCTRISNSGIIPEEQDFDDFSIDLSCLNSIGSMLLDSPYDTNQDDAANNVINVGADPTSADSAYLHVTRDGSNVSNASSDIDRRMVCLLNTEDPEIPCNDDVVLGEVTENLNPIPNPNPNPNSETLPLSTKSLLRDDGEGTSADLTVVNEGEKLGGNSINSQACAQVLNANANMNTCIARENMGLVRTSSSVPVALRQNSTDPTDTNTEIAPPLKEDQAALLTVVVPLTENSVPPFDHMNYYTSGVPNGCKMETGDQVAMERCAVPLQSSATSAGQAGLSASDKDEQVSQNEDDVPSFSDIEAMILDMDLSPHDQESLLVKEVSRFHCMESMKSLIRLERGARSYMNRAVISRGAFAVIYGRHMKYFIKNPEVSIGRETEDVKVDIDLGKEGRANKISRRQAIIKMDESGSFHIKNIGKCSIFVNSREVPAKKRINLSSGSLIEIRDMRFIFEVNEKAVRKYLSNNSHSNEARHGNNKWDLSQNP